MHENELPLQPYIPPTAECVFKGVRFDVYALKRGNTPREVIVHPGAVVILPLLDARRIILIHNERFSVGETLWELPAGTLEQGEHPSETASRELEEETGYHASAVVPLTQFYPTPGFCNERMFAYTAIDLTPTRQQLDESEKIGVDVFSWDDALQMVKERTIKDAKTISTLLFYHAFYR